MRSNILQEVKLSKVIFHAKKAAGGTPYPSLAAGKLQIQWEVREVRKQRSVAKKKNTSNDWVLQFPSWSAICLAFIQQRKLPWQVVYYLSHSQICSKLKKNSLLGCPATPTSSISREINCHGFCTVSLAYSFLVICMSDKENNELPLFLYDVFDIKGASFIAEVKSSAQPAGFRDRTGVVYIAPRITAPFLGCKHQDLKHCLNRNVWSLHLMQSQKRNEEIIKKIRFSFVPQIPLATCLPSNVFGRSVPTAVRIMIPGCFTTSTVPVLATLVCKRTQIKPFQVPCVSTKLKNKVAGWYGALACTNSEFWNLKRAICGTFEKPWCWCTWISCGRAMTPRGNLVFRYSETMISELKL